VKSSSLGAYASCSDAVLVDALRANEEGAFAEIYQRYCYPLFTLAYRKLKDREVAEELVQDLFENLWSRRAENQIQQLSNYLFTAVKYRIINYLKVQKVKAGYELFCRLSASQAAADTTTEDALALHDLSSALRASVQQLPEIGEERRIPFNQVAEATAQLLARLFNGYFTTISTFSIIITIHKVSDLLYT
jgi:DNA-directed RNA polymerase specialized sigma24 family protein